jgi:uncharacterized membrane protein SpoIIM required for sporulation
MRQAVFEAHYARDWDGLEAWLDRNEKRRGRRDKTPADPNEPPDADVPQAYRRVCQHLALARDRQYSPELVDRLNQLALRGHHLLYGARTRRGFGRTLEFFLAGFPRLVREEWKLVTAAACLFFGPLFSLIAALQVFPDFAYYILDPEMIGRMQGMYDPSNEKLGRRDSDDNVMMFGFYIWNNVKITFQTFATGIAFGLGTIFFLVFNGVFIGAVAGHLTHAGFAVPFWSFVAGHSALELIAIAIAGAAGLRLGAAVIAPGLRSRKAALVAAARPAVRLVYGAAAMDVLAAFIEAFWSPLTTFAPLTKYVVGAALWGLVIGYFLFVGRRGA